MGKKLTDDEKRRALLAREEYTRNAGAKLTERHYEMLRILREADEHPGTKFNSKYFERYFGVANVTVLRLARDLRELDLIETKHNQYRIKAEVGELYSAETEKNLALVAGIKGLLQQYKNTPLFESLEKLVYFLEPKIFKEGGLLSKSRVAVPPQIEYRVNTGNWSLVCRAMRENRKISFRYSKAGKDEKIRRTVRPYQILLDDGTVYLFAYSERAGTELLYNLNRMRDILIADETFSLPDNFEFSAHCGGGRLGAYKGISTERYRIRFTGEAKEWVKEHKLADDQKFEEDADSVTVEFSSGQSEKVFALVMGWGKNARPLAPKKFAARWKDEIRALYESLDE